VSKLVSIAGRLLLDKNFTPRELSELACALGTVELRRGEFGRSRKLFTDALTDPSDNSVAQIAWASPTLGLEYDRDTLSTPTAWEARAIAAHRDGRWKMAIDEAQMWIRDQPFASRPAALASYEASKGGMFELGASLARGALEANPDEFILLNNAAFCLLSMGRVDSAITCLARINERELSDDERVTFDSTHALLLYRRGEYERGRATYLEAINTCRDPTTKALVKILLAREELHAHRPDADAAVVEAQQAGSENQSELCAWLRQLTPSGSTLTPSGST
jgi:tetratricopeptide (TPR) repeat protein